MPGHAPPGTRMYQTPSRIRMSAFSAYFCERTLAPSAPRTGSTRKREFENGAPLDASVLFALSPACCDGTPVMGSCSRGTTMSTSSRLLLNSVRAHVAQFAPAMPSQFVHPLSRFVASSRSQSADATPVHVAKFGVAVREIHGPPSVLS